MSEQKVPPICPGEKRALVIGDKVYKSSNDWELTEKEIVKARVELGETKEEKERCLRELKKKLSKDENVNYRTDDAYLLRFLRLRKYDIGKTYKNVKLFLHMRKRKPDFFTLPPNLKSVLDLNYLTFLPYTDEEGRVIFWMNIERWKPEEKPFEEIFQGVTAVWDISSMNPKCQINGVIGLWDAKGLTARHLAELLRNDRLSTSFMLSANGYPWRIHKMILLNSGRILRLIYSIIRPLLSRKVAERVIFLGSDMNELHKYVNPALLPKDLGGVLDEEECNVTQQIMDNLPYLRYEKSFL